MNRSLQWRIWPPTKLCLQNAPTQRCHLNVIQSPQPENMQGKPCPRNCLAKKSVWLFVYNQPCLRKPHSASRPTRQVHNLMQPQTFIRRGATSMILLPWGHLLTWCDILQGWWYSLPELLECFDYDVAFHCPYGIWLGFRGKVCG